MHDVLAEYLHWLATERQKGAATVRAYRSDLRAFAQWLEQSGRPLLEVTRFELRRYLVELEEQGLAATSVQRKLASGELSFVNGGTGKNGCMVPPVTARFTSAQESEIVSVSFRAGKTAVADDTAAPFEAALPDAAIRKELPAPATVTAKALFDDGRRLGQAANVKLCK